MPGAPARPDLAAWIARIRDEEMPIFGATAEQIARLSGDESTSVAKLAEAILHDPGMTAKLLRISNSVIFNTLGHQVTTISRTILLLGFNTVRDVALSVAFVEGFLRGSPRGHVLREVARSFHGAIQARWIAARRHDAAVEEVFVAALLFRLGEICFWCFAAEEGEVLEEALRKSRRPAADVERAVLGFRLRQLTVGLLREWRVSPLLQNALTGAWERDSRERCVVLAHRLVEALEAGRDAEAARVQIAAVADYLKLPPREVATAVAANAELAARAAQAFGADSALPHIPRPDPAPPPAEH